MAAADEWSEWRRFFKARAGRPLPPLVADHDYDYLPRSLARAIAVFQLGESGGGSVVGQAATSGLPGAGPGYAEALRLFCAEEQRHANILAMCVRLMDGELLASNWTDRLFVGARRLLGVRLKIMVLLAAEVIGIAFYRMVAERLPPGAMQDWLMDIVGDEESHVSFHEAFLAQQIKGFKEYLLFLVTWRAVLKAAELSVLLDHRRCFADMLILPADFKTQVRELGREVEARLRHGSRRKAPVCRVA